MWAKLRALPWAIAIRPFRSQDEKQAGEPSHHPLPVPSIQSWNAYDCQGVSRGLWSVAPCGANRQQQQAGTLKTYGAHPSVPPNEVVVGLVPSAFAPAAQSGSGEPAAEEQQCGGLGDVDLDG